MRLTRLLFFSAGLAFCGSLEGQVVLEPSLGVAFPVKEEGPGLVLSSAVLLNMNDILPAGTVLHRLFPKPKKDDKDVRSRKIREYDTGKYAVTQRLAIENRELDPNKTAVMKATEDRAGGEAMTSELKFRAMLHRMNIEEYYLAYDMPGSADRRIGQFDYPEGLLLGEPAGKITVLATARSSLAEKNGVGAGTRILALNGITLKSLEDFRDRYFKEKEERKAQGKALTMTLLLPEASAPQEMEFPTKRSLGSTADLMSDLDQSAKGEGGVESPARKEATPAPQKKAGAEEMDIPLIP